MEFIRVQDANAISVAAEAVRAGGIIIYPTDTLYGIGVDARSWMAMHKADKLKNREDKPVSVVVADMAMAEQYCQVGALARKYAKHLLPGPYTFVLERKGEGIARNVAGDTIGIRIPKSEFPIALVHELGFPITSTSANLTEMPPAGRLEEVDEVVQQEADVVVDGGPCEHNEGSTVIDVRGKSADPIKFL